MPRILPRLLTIIQRSPEQKSWDPFILPRKKRISLYRPVPSRPSFQPSHHPTSILLNSPETNPITKSRVYDRHKTLPPRPDSVKRVKKGKAASQDASRGMTEQELEWWSSPYLRMLASPIRRCIATERSMPSDFLIRMASMRLPQSTELPNQRRNTDDSQVFIPDGLLHRRFTARKSDRAQYLLCNRSAIPHLAKHSTKRRAAQSISAHPFLADHIAHLLRLRVLQELELLAESMEASLRQKKQIWTYRIIRRLSSLELDALHATNTIPHPGAIAVLIVPPLQNDPVTGRLPEPSMSAAPPKPEEMSTAIEISPMPVCTLHRVGPPQWDDTLGDGVLPEASLPLYNGVSMFPLPGQRAALHTLLKQLLAIEERFRHVEDSEGETEQNGQDSDAFLLTSNAQSALRGDVAAVAIALWRVRMFDGYGEDVASQSTMGWERT